MEVICEVMHFLYGNDMLSDMFIHFLYGSDIYDVICCISCMESDMFIYFLYGSDMKSEMYINFLFGSDMQRMICNCK